jgi:hypothetical protein
LIARVESSGKLCSSQILKCSLYKLGDSKISFASRVSPESLNSFRLNETKLVELSGELCSDISLIAIV